VAVRFYEIPRSSLVGYWKMENNWNDVSGNGRNGAVVGNPNFSSSSKLGSYAGNFAGGTGNYVYFGSTSGINISDTTFSVSLWLKTTVGGALISKGSGVGQAGGFTVNTDGSGYLQVYLKDTTGSQAALLSGNVPLNDGLWHHLVVNFNTSTTTSSGNNIVAYLDGVVHGSISRSGYFFGGTTLDSIAVGARGAPVNGPSSFYAGQLDDVAVFSTSLTQSEIQTIYARQSPKYSGLLTSRVLDAYSSQSWTTLASTTTLPFYKELPGASGSESSTGYSSIGGSLMTGIVGLWHLNETSGTSAIDSSGSGINGALSGSYGLASSGQIGSAIGLGGGTINFGDNFSFVGTQSHTFAFWIKTTSGYTNIFTKRSGSPGSWEGWIMYTAGGNMMFERERAGVQNLVQTSSAAINDGFWHHVTYTYDGSSMKFYVDGKANGSTANTTSIVNAGVNATVIANPATMDEFAIWSRALSATEVKELYRRGSNRVKYQLRSCSASDCSDQDALTTSYKGWKGPDNRPPAIPTANANLMRAEIRFVISFIGKSSFCEGLL